MAGCSGSTEGAPIRVQHDYAIGGIPLKFPCKPYPTQMAMMAKIITALNKGENALLESPTGSGKSLALLCSSLAWLHHKKTHIETDLMKAKLEGHQNDASMSCVCECHALKEQQQSSSNQTLHAATPTPAPNVNAGRPTPLLSIPGPTNLVPPIPLLSSTHSATPTKSVPLLSIPGSTPLLNVPIPLLSFNFSSSTQLPVAPLSNQIAPGNKASLLSLPGSTHLATPTPLLQLSVSTPIQPSTLTSGAHSSGGAAVSSGKSLVTLLPSMILPTTVPPVTNSNLNTQCSVNTVAMGSLVVSTTSSSSSTAQIVLSSKEPNSVVSRCSNSCSSGQPDEASRKDDRNKVPNTEPNKPEREIDEAKNQEIEKMEIKEEEAEDGGVKNEGAESAAVRGEGDDGEGKSEKEKEKEVIVLDDSLDDDFKQTKKRFRTPAATTKDGPTQKKRKGRVKGVQYVDEGSDGVADSSLLPDQHGHPTWRIENRNETQKGPSSYPHLPPSLLYPPSSLPSSSSSFMSTPSVPSAAKTSSPSLPLLICPKCGCTQATTGKDTSSGAAKPDPMKTVKSKPQIFFGTRTHKQITQITHEMAKTAYSETPMCILASREHTCIHPKVSKSRNKNDDCKKLRDYVEGVSCSWFHRVQQKLGSQCQLRQHGYTSAWDIEDLVKLGRRVRACPYFALRGLKEDAEIIFCPYNYLIDPMIREQMLIDLTDKVIILDEAHNMEDSAREAASLSVNHIQISEVLKEITELLPEQDNDEVKLAYQKLQALCSAIVRWIDESVMRLAPHGYEQAYGIWNGEDFLPVLEKELCLTQMSVSIYENALKTVTDSGKEDEEDRRKGGLPEVPPPTLSVSSQALIKSILLVVGYLFRENKRYLPDYRIALLKTATMARPREVSGWISKRRRSQALEKVWTTSLNFWCLNPAVAFSDLTRAHSIVLTSGTLSPMTSFSSELGVKFAIQLEASHVIPETQTWINSISHGPNGRSLIANYQNSETFQFQDEVGEVVLRVCQTVPYGVLCFFSSYKMLEKLAKRWQDTGMWNKIDQSKSIFCEPRSGRKEDFEEAISSYYQVIAESAAPIKQECPNDNDRGHYSGALFLAVCRGKVSEGLDFADNNARAVITIGIPFPNIKDKQVELKREYNNEHCHKRGVLTGSEWYEIQAYRALNQALGRCIRHKKDWGALILIDERYSKGHHYTKGLSKWIRQRLHHQSDFNHSMKLLQAFTENMMGNGDANDLSRTIDQSSLLKSPSVSVSLGTSMNSPGLQIRNMSTTLLETANTPTTFGKYDHCQATPMPSSPSFSGPVGTTLHTSTPVAPCKSALAHSSCEDCMPGSSLTPANTDSTVNYAITNGSNATANQNPGTIAFAHMSMQSQKANQSLQQSSGQSKDCTTSSYSFINLSQLRDTFRYPGNPTPKKSNSHHDGENSIQALTELTTGSKQEERSPVICIEESPPNTQGIESNDISDAKGGCDEVLLSTKVTDHQERVLAKHTSQEVISKTPDLRPGTLSLDSGRSESPVLFDTPGCIGGPQSIAAKLSSIVNLNKQPTSDHSNWKADFDDDKTPPISPEDNNTEDIKLKNELDGQPVAQWKDEKNLCANPSCGEMTSKSLSPEKRSLSRKQHKRSSALGQPRTRRVNTRMATRKSTAENSVCGSSTVTVKTNKSVENDEDDFMPDRRTPRKQATVAEPMDVQENNFKIMCHCGKILSKKCVSLERLELKEALTSKYGNFKPTKIQSSKLWGHLKGSIRSRAKTLPVIIVPHSQLDCSSKPEGGVYNAVWDDKVLLCYSLLRCKCDKLVGVSVHSSISGHGFGSLNGKDILQQNEVTVNEN